MREESPIKRYLRKNSEKVSTLEPNEVEGHENIETAETNTEEEEDYQIEPSCTAKHFNNVILEADNYEDHIIEDTYKCEEELAKILQINDSMVSQS